MHHKTFFFFKNMAWYGLLWTGTLITHATCKNEHDITVDISKYSQKNLSLWPCQLGVIMQQMDGIQ